MRQSSDSYSLCGDACLRMSDPPPPIIFVLATPGKCLPVGWLSIGGSGWGEMSAVPVIASVIVFVHTIALSSPLIAVVSALGFSTLDTSDSLMFPFSGSLPEREAETSSSLVTTGFSSFV